MKYLPIPVLIYAPRKSGSTLLHNLLDGHSNVISIPGEVKLTKIVSSEKEIKERGFFDWFCEHGVSFLNYEILSGSNEIYKKLGNLDKKTIEKNFNVEKFIELFWQKAEHCKFSDKNNTNLTAVFNHFLQCYISATNSETSQKKYIIFKEVGGNPVLVLLLFKSIFPEGKVILNTRSTVYTTRSIILDRSRKGISLSFKKVIMELLEANTINQVIHSINTNANINTYWTSYEKIITNTEKEMKTLTKFLNIEFEDSLLIPSVLSCDTIVVTSSKKTTEVFSSQLTEKWDSGLLLHQKIAFLCYFLICYLSRYKFFNL